MDKKIQFGKTTIGDSIKTVSIDSSGIRTNEFTGGNSHIDSKPYGIFTDTPIHEIGLASTVVTPGITGGVSMKAFVYLKNYYERFHKITKKIEKFTDILNAFSEAEDYSNIDFANRSLIYEKISKGWKK